jgi:hypothetical protein
MTNGPRDLAQSLQYMANMNYGHAAATRSIGDTVAQLVQIVDALVDRVGDPGLKVAVNQARMTLEAGRAQAQALADQADAIHYRQG